MKIRDGYTIEAVKSTICGGTVSVTEENAKHSSKTLRPNYT